MAENSGISWTDHTFNPWRGCLKVSPACANCYADRLSKRNPSTFGVWGSESSGATRVVASESMWQQPVKWNAQAEQEGKRLRVFCASLADVFEDWGIQVVDSHGKALNPAYEPATASEIDDGDLLSLCDVRRRLFQLIDATPNLDWLLLTKRPENIIRMWPMTPGLPATVGDRDIKDVRATELMHRPNVWLGTTVENQEYADKRIPELLRCRDLCDKLFLSCEPLLGPIDLSQIPTSPKDRVQAHVLRGTYEMEHPGDYETQAAMQGFEGGPKIDWVIAGGESGSKARPSHPEWFRSLRDQCSDAGVPFHFKQWGEHCPSKGFDPEIDHDVRIDLGGRDVTGLSGLWDESDAFMHRDGVKAAGRTLDGVEHLAFPSVDPSQMTGDNMLHTEVPDAH